MTCERILVSHGKRTEQVGVRESQGDYDIYCTGIAIASLRVFHLISHFLKTNTTPSSTAFARTTASRGGMKIPSPIERRKRFREVDKDVDNGGGSACEDRIHMKPYPPYEKNTNGYI